MTENYFDRLPTELIVLIFEKLLDAKSLCICYSVSKYFAAHVLQTRFVSVEIPYSLGICGFLNWPEGVKNFLKKLSCVESASLSFSISPITRSMWPTVIRWKSDSSGFIFVSAEEEDTPPANDTRTHVVYPAISSHLHGVHCRFRYVEELIAVLPSLKHVSAVDSLKQGSIVLGEEDIASTNNRRCCSMKLWVVPKVRSSLSGRVLKNVCLVFTREIGAPAAAYDDSLIAGNLLEDNEYREIAMKMMKKGAVYESCTSYASTMTGTSYLLSFIMPHRVPFTPAQQQIL